ncbi:MAG: zf-TFIIB domain-containing protein [Phycisphaerales bacterium]|nr:zf-TFIIB domain-containing protein [Phycisphaerales bacterium]
MKCPKCQTGLTIADRQGVEIDFCPNCRGVWLDRGELDKIIDRAGAYSGGPPPVPSRRELDDDDHDYEDDDDRNRRQDRTAATKPRKRSWLGDLLDFD